MKISVITATYNSGATIEDTLRSVLNQTYGNIEHIVIDGNSTDATMDIVRKYADLYRRRGLELKWISEPDKGIYDAMNKGISLACGDIVGLLNSDDFFTVPTVIEKVASVFSEKEGEIDAVYGDIHY
ncbi:MAG: glycosyltransferase, partial [Muribaculaceae bacterium]|nr:glycosyltransferase [Muribaculaceae bacterium]